MPLSKRFVAEFIGTLWLAAAFPNLGIGFLRRSLLSV